MYETVLCIYNKLASALNILVDITFGKLLTINYILDLNNCGLWEMKIIGKYLAVKFNLSVLYQLVVCCSY